MEVLKMKLERERKSSSGKNQEFSKNEEYLQHIIEEKNVFIAKL